jgi:hypothetical protein
MSPENQKYTQMYVCNSLGATKTVPEKEFMESLTSGDPTINPFAYTRLFEVSFSVHIEKLLQFPIELLYV